MRDMKARNYKNYNGYNAGEKIVTENDFHNFGGKNLEDAILEQMGHNLKALEKDERQRLEILKSSAYKQARKRQVLFKMLMPQLQGGTTNFILTTASNNATLLNDIDYAQREGKINLRVKDIGLEGEEEKFERVSDLIEYINGEMQEYVRDDLMEAQKKAVMQKYELTSEKQLTDIMKDEIKKLQTQNVTLGIINEAVKKNRISDFVPAPGQKEADREKEAKDRAAAA